MDLRTKLVFALVAVALGSMLALGLSTYPRARELLRASALQTLEGVAGSKANDLENVTRAWRDRVLLIASRTQLRISLAYYGRTHDPAEKIRIQQIIDDASRSVPAVRRITIYDVDLHPVAITGGDPASVPDLQEELVPGRSGAEYRGLQSIEGGGLAVRFAAPLDRDGQRVGTVEVVLSAHELIDVTQDLAGLGTTGEIVIAYAVSDDSAVIVNPLRHLEGGPLTRKIGLQGATEPTARAVLGHSRGTEADAIDYRGKRVWAATRFLPDLGWGLVVKFDADEQEQPFVELRSYMVTLALSLSAFAILIGTILGLQLARPIHALAEVANRIRSGELDARSNATSNDELGQLARTFDQMAQQLIETNQELQRRIGDAASGMTKSTEKPPT